MKRFKLIDVIIALLFLGILILAVWGYLSNAHAGDYIITIYRNFEVIVIEHDGEISAFGYGDKSEDKFSRAPIEVVGESLYSYNEDEAQLIYLNKQAQQWEAKGDWYDAAWQYRNIDEIEKMEEMAHKDIEYELDKDPPHYRGAYITAKNILKDEDLAEYYRSLWNESNEQ